MTIHQPQVEARTPMTPLKILIVEDEPITRFMMCEFSDQLGHHHESASSGAQCLEMLHKDPRRADILLMDIHMPDMSGVETCHRLREALAGRHDRLTIIALTADEFWQNPRHCAAAGFDGVISKPISIDGLDRALQAAHRDPPDDAPDQPSTPQTAAFRLSSK